jgi:hypothetical protein
MTIQTDHPHNIDRLCESNLKSSLYSKGNQKKKQVSGLISPLGKSVYEINKYKQKSNEYRDPLITNEQYIQNMWIGCQFILLNRS